MGQKRIHEEQDIGMEEDAKKGRLMEEAVAAIISEKGEVNNATEEISSGTQ